MGSEMCIRDSFYTGAMLSLIRWWLSSDEPLPTSHLLSNLEQFIPIQ